MEHYRLLESFDTEVGTSFIGFDLTPTSRGYRSYPTLSGTLSALWIYGDSLSSANSLTVRVTEDAEGDRCIIGDTQVGFSTGITTSTMTSSVIKIEIEVADTWPAKVWVKTDTGTFNVREVKITWRV
jgi:hypothetical protein